MRAFFGMAVFLLSLCKVHAGIHATFEDRLNNLEAEAGIKPPPTTTRVKIFGDFLYWKTSLDGVAWATTAEVVSAPGGGTTFDEFKTRTVHFEYAPAFQVGAGIDLPFDNWDASVHWLRSYTTGRDHAQGALSETVGNRVILDDIGLIQQLSNVPSRASAKCHVHLNLVDAVLGRTFLWSKYFSFRPYAGIMGAWLNMNWDLKFTVPVVPNSPQVQTYTFADIHNRYHAAGLLGGFESEWNFYQALGLFSHVSAALVYGRSSEKTQQEFFLVPAESSTAQQQNFSAKNSALAVKAIVDVAIGLKWAVNFYKDYRLLLRAGYDFFYWPAVAQKTVTQANRIRDRADLSFQGVLISGKLDF